jgi:hypothetical protein
MRTREDILKEKLKGIHFIQPDTTYALVLQAMEEYALEQTLELKAYHSEELKVRNEILSSYKQQSLELKAENERLLQREKDLHYENIGQRDENTRLREALESLKIEIKELCRLPYFETVRLRTCVEQIESALEKDKPI